VLYSIAGGASESFDFRGAERPQHQKSISVTELDAASADTPLTILDVRLAEDFAADPQLLPDALYRDPELIEAWAGTLPRDTKVIVYCVRGKWVSHKAADFLDRKGLDVYVLEGGLEAWQQKAE
jgi:rhodanese-related sulfurtransferase